MCVLVVVVVVAFVDVSVVWQIFAVLLSCEFAVAVVANESVLGRLDIVTKSCCGCNCIGCCCHCHRRCLFLNRAFLTLLVVVVVVAAVLLLLLLLCFLQTLSNLLK